MQFSYHENASNESLEIDGDLYKYLIKARRHKLNEQIAFRNFKDDILYLYKIESIDRKKSLLSLVSSEEKVVENTKKLHIGWCMVDPKTVEKSIASLNEIGVDRITFIYCEYSQKSFKLNLEKLKKILINSSCQCGRSSIIEIEVCESLDKFLKENVNVYALDFSKNLIDNKSKEIETIVLGCEGGFSLNEQNYFEEDKVVGFDSNLILRSETAIISAASKILI